MAGFVCIAALVLLAALMMAGVVTALAGANMGKRVVAVLVALFAAALALAALGAPQVAVTSAAALALVYCVVGVTLLVRLQEGYASGDVAAIDAEDARSEPVEPDA